MNNIIKSLRETTTNNVAVQKAVKHYLKEAKERAAQGHTYMGIIEYYCDGYIGAVVRELEKLGFRRYTEPVYGADGVIQYGTWMTWF